MLLAYYVPRDAVTHKGTDVWQNHNCTPPPANHFSHLAQAFLVERDSGGFCSAISYFLDLASCDCRLFFSNWKQHWKGECFESGQEIGEKQRWSAIAFERRHSRDVNRCSETTHYIIWTLEFWRLFYKIHVVYTCFLQGRILFQHTKY